MFVFICFSINYHSLICFLFVGWGVLRLISCCERSKVLKIFNHLHCICIHCLCHSVSIFFAFLQVMGAVAGLTVDEWSSF